MSVDQAYVRQLAVAVASIARTTDDPCRVHVLHDGLPPADRDRVHASLSDLVDIEWIDADTAIRGRPLPMGFPRSMYFRLFLAELLPGDLERALYLDADLIVRRPLGELWAADLGAAPVGAVRDAYRPWIVRNPSIRWRELHVAPEAPFFNSGMMLVSLEQWRDQEVGTRSLALLSERSPLLDQCALNVALENNWAALHPAWNVQSYHLTGDECLAFVGEGRDRIDEALADPAIVHFTGGSFNRPWQAPCGNPYRDEWLACLDRTAWRGWRPEPSPAIARAWGRTKRAARVLRHGGGAEAGGSGDVV